MRYLIPLLFAFAWIPTADAQPAKPSGGLEGRVGRLEGIVEQIDKRLTNIEHDQRETLKRVEAMNREINIMRGEMNSMRGELTTMRGEIGSMRGEMNIMSNEINSVKRDMTTMRGEMNSMRGEMTTMRSELSNEISATFRWLVGIVVTLFLGNVGVNWYWNRKSASTEAPRSVPHREESRPAASPSLVNQP